MMRGQATSTQHRLSEIFSLTLVRIFRSSLRGGAKRLATGLSPTNQWSTTTMPQGKLPSYLQSLHHIRPARPSMGSSGLGSDVLSNLSVKQNTWKLPDISSLHNVCRTRKQPKPIAKLLFLQKISLSLSSTPSELVELSGIEPLTPCLQSRCSPS